MPTLIIILTITCLIFFSGLFVSAEFAAVGVRRPRLAELAEAGNPLAKTLLATLEDSRALEEYVATCQIGISATVLILGAYTQRHLVVTLTPWLTQSVYIAETLALTISAIIVLLCLTTIQVIAGELLPKTIATQYSERIALLTIIPLRLLGFMFRPFIWWLNRSASLILTVAGLKYLLTPVTIHTPQEIEILITESHEGGLLDAGEQQLLRNAFRLRDLTARQVMVPRTRLVAAPIESTTAMLMNKAIEEGYSRIPLYEKTIDNIIGFVHVKDLFKLYLQDKQDPTEILREVTYVPESLGVAEVWATLNRHGHYLAVVFDEYGGTAGLITFEDLLEEIFGEFQDEFDEDELPLIASDQAGRVYLRGDLLVTDINEYLNLKLPDDDADTIGGLVFTKLGRPAEIGDEVIVGLPEVTIQVEAMEGRRITEVSLQLPVGFKAYIGEWEMAHHE